MITVKIFLTMKTRAKIVVKLMNSITEQQTNTSAELLSHLLRHNIMLRKMSENLEIVLTSHIMLSMIQETQQHQQILKLTIMIQAHSSHHATLQ